MVIDNETPEEQEVRRIIRVLREKPEIAGQVRRAFLSEELLQLPDRFAKFVVPDGEFGCLASDVKAIAADIGDIKGRVTTLESDMTAIEGDVQVLKGDVQHIKDDRAALRGEFFEDRLRARLDDYLDEDLSPVCATARARARRWPSQCHGARTWSCRCARAGHCPRGRAASSQAPLFGATCPIRR